MIGMGGGGQFSLQLLISLAVVIPILFLGNRRPRRLKIELLWIRPAVFAAIVVLGLFGLGAPPPLSLATVGLILAGVILGGVLGWQRGRLMRIEVHPETHEINQAASPLAMVFIIVLLVLRVGARDVAFGNLGLPISAIVVAFGLSSLSLVCAQATEMWIRARRLLAEARAAKASAGEAV